MAIVQHNDFGEKIGGAKKDLWQRRGLLSDDLKDMNEREADKYVKKDNIWKKPDYQELIESGIPVDVAYYIKTVRDSLEAAPVYRRADDTPEKKLARQMQYIDTVRDVQSILESVKSKNDVLSAFDKFVVSSGFFEQVRPGASGTYYSATEKGRENPAITDKLSRTMLIRSEWDYKQKITYKAEKQQFGVSKLEKIPKGYEINFNDGKHSWSANNDWKPDTYYVAKGHHILKTNFETKEDALKWVQSFVQQKGGDGKKRFIPEQLEHIQRNGRDYRRGTDVDGNDYLNTFGFKGGEFGNWMTQNDRQASLNYGYDALKDLAAALKISDNDISYQGALSIAFGARGSGNAVAHYEPLRNVINLTKMNGAGSLAHEWFHGLDDYLGTKMGLKGYLSENPRRGSLFAKLIETIKYKEGTPEQAAAAVEKQNARTKYNAESWLKAEVLPAIQRSGNEKALAEYGALKDAFLRGEIGFVDKMNDLKKNVSGNVIPKDIREKLYIFERLLNSITINTEPATLRVETDYYRASKEMGKVCEKDGNYWESNVELTARAFATYIMDILPGRSDYLAGHAECAVAPTADKDGNLEIICAFPQGEERKAINAVFDEIIAELKLQQYLTHDEHTWVEPEQRLIPESVPQELSSCVTIDLSNNYGEQLSIFSLPEKNAAAAKPSMLGGLAAAKAVVAERTGKQANDAVKKHEETSL